MRPMRSEVSMAAGDPNGVVEAVIINGAATLDGALVTGGVATFATPRHVDITGSSTVTAVNFTIVGTDRYGNAITEVLLGPVGTATVKGLFNFKTITSITSAGTTTAAVTIGEADEAEGPWIPLDHYQQNFNVHLDGRLIDSGATTFEVQTTIDEIQAIGFQENDAVALADGTFTGKSAAFASDLTSPVEAIRLALTSHTAGGVRLTVVQSGGHG